MTDGARSAGEFERILAENRRYVEAFDRSALTAAPLSGLAVLACMDARLDVEEALGLRTGDAHIIRNAGGLATEDAIRSTCDRTDASTSENVPNSSGTSRPVRATSASRIAPSVRPSRPHWV